MNNITPLHILILSLTTFSLFACNSDSGIPPSSADSTPPEVAITSPADSSTVVDSTIVTIVASDNIGVTEVELYVDGSLISIHSSVSWQYHWNVRSLLPYSVHRLLAKAHDAANNIGNSPVLTVAVTRTPPPDTNLIPNGSFELNGIASREGWSYWEDDTSLYAFARDVPPGGGQFSARLTSGWTWSEIEAKLPAPQGKHQYRLSAWGKKGSGFVPAFPPPAGGITLMLVHNGTPVQTRSIVFPDSVWTPATVADTLTAAIGDSLFVKVSGGYSQFGDGYNYFDLCRLEKLD